MTTAELELLEGVLEDARRDLDEPAPDSRCGECGAVWAAGWIAGTGSCPGEPVYPDCPRCGSDCVIGL